MGLGMVPLIYSLVVGSGRMSCVIARRQNTMAKGRIVIIPFSTASSPRSTLIEPDIDAILESGWERHPEFRGRKFHVIQTGGTETCLVRVTADYSPDLADYDPATDADLYEGVSCQERGFIADSRRPGPNNAGRPGESKTSSAPTRPSSTLIEQKFIDFLDSRRDRLRAFGPRSPPSWPRSRPSSSLGSCESAWTRPARPNLRSRSLRTRRT